MDYVLVFCRFVHYAAAFSVFGSSLFRSVLGRGEPGAFSGLDRYLLRGNRFLAGLLMLSALAWLCLVAASMEGAWQAAFDPSVISTVLFDTHFGHAWRWHLLFCLGLLLGYACDSRQARLLRLPLAAAVVASLAPIGHVAMLSGWAGVGLVFNQIIHLLCAGAWFGGLLFLGASLHGASLSLSWTMLRRFSHAGYGLVAGVLGTGVLNVWALTGEWPDPRESMFGLVLTIKLALVACMLMLAIFNFRVLTVRRRQQLPALRRSVLFEWGCGLAAVAAVSLLGTLQPMPA